MSSIILKGDGDGKRGCSNKESCHDDITFEPLQFAIHGAALEDGLKVTAIIAG